MLLGIDVGTTNTKVGVYDADGLALAHVQAPTPRETNADGLEQIPPDELWRTAAELMRRATRDAGTPIVALAVSAMGESGVPLDAEGRPTYGIIPWYDPRSQPQLHELRSRIDPERCVALTGLVPSYIYTLCKWMWLRDNAPEAWARTRLWQSSMGFVRLRLGGEAVMTDTQAARTMAFDVRRGDWAETMLAAAGLDGTFLPPVVTGTRRVGEVTAEAADATGLAAGTPIFAGGHDHFCAALACGALTPELILDSQGTAEALTLGLAEPPDPSRAGGFSTGPHVITGHSYREGGVRSSGRALRWARETLAFESFDALRDAAATVAPGDAPLFIAHLGGTAPPFNQPEATGAFTDLTPDHGRAHLARAVYEGVAFELRRTLERLEATVGRPVEVLRVAGGTANDPLWFEMRAAILGRRLEVSAHADMVTLGAALLAGIGAGRYRSAQEAVARTYRTSREFLPEPEAREIYDRIYPRYHQTAARLRGSPEHPHGSERKD